jgi:N-acetylglucosaminyltransferase
MTHMLFLAACALGAVLICVPLFILLGASRKGSGIHYDDNYQPTVAIITPMYNEGFSIRRTIESILRQDYPAHLREIIIVDDCSSDDSYQHALDALKGVANARVVRNATNMGKRRSINRALGMTKAEIVVSVDSDVVVEPEAVTRMIRCFSSAKVAAVGGRVAILNERESWLTRMQAVKYYYSYFLIKRVELRFRSVLCLSGCLTAYRRTVLQELLPVLENRNLLGVEIKYGEDRFLTRMIVKAGYETIMNPNAVCRTVGPTSVSVYLSQQLRWRRSNLVDYLGGLSHVWRGHPLVAFYFFSLFVAILLYPALLVSALATGKFWQLMTCQLAISFLLGAAYRLHAYKDPNASVWNAIPLAFLFPLTYGILTPVALLTLDAGSWETRSHEATVDAPHPVREVPATISLPAAPVVSFARAELMSITSRLKFQADRDRGLSARSSNE